MFNFFKKKQLPQLATSQEQNESIQRMIDLLIKHKIVRQTLTSSDVEVNIGRYGLCSSLMISANNLADPRLQHSLSSVLLDSWGGKFWVEIFENRRWICSVSFDTEKKFDLYDQILLSQRALKLKTLYDTKPVYFPAEQTK